MTTSFAHTNYPTRHPGVERAARVADGFKAFARAFDGTRATASLLLAAIVSALLVVANQVVDTWTEGHLLAAWIVMWAVAFAALALFAAPAASAARAVRNGYAAWRKDAIQRHHDEQFWQAALKDARIMADISRAMSASAMRDVKAYY
ncbi:hypothetical protein [Ramlibacter sp. PS4R-6]|uniref:hypothetical protein n=1 Tax=Ramlibacter sp. PS4R-6 TaxID=3133438 RepID=UPI003096A04C